MSERCADSSRSWSTFSSRSVLVIPWAKISTTTCFPVVFSLKSPCLCFLLCVLGVNSFVPVFFAPSGWTFSQNSVYSVPTKFPMPLPSLKAATTSLSTVQPRNGRRVFRTDADKAATQIFPGGAPIASCKETTVCLHLATTAKSTVVFLLLCTNSWDSYLSKLTKPRDEVVIDLFNVCHAYEQTVARQIPIRYL